MYPHEKPGYVDACRAAGVCPAAFDNAGLPVYCDVVEHDFDEQSRAVHVAHRPWRELEWTSDHRYAINFGTPLEGGS